MPESDLALRQIVRDLANNTSDEAELLQRLAQGAAQLVAAESACVFELAGDQLHPVASAGETRDYHALTHTLRQSSSLFGDLIASREPWCVNDIHDLPVDPLFREALNVRQAAVVPIMVDGVRSGLLLCVNALRGRFSAEDCEQLSQLADVGALVLRTQRLTQRAASAVRDARSRAEDAARAAQHNAVLARTSRMFADAMTRESVFESVASVLRSELGAAGFAVYEADARLRTVRLAYQVGAGRIDGARVTAVFFQSVLGDVLRSGDPQYIGNLRERLEMVEMLGAQSQLDEGVGAIALLPLLLDGVTRGVLSVRFLGTRPFDAEDRRLLTDIATHVAIAYRNLRHLAELERRADRLGAMATAQQQLTHVTNADALPAAIADAVHRVIPCAQCDVLALTPDGLTRVLQTAGGQVVVPAPIPPEELTLAQETLRTGVARLAIHVGDSEAAPRGTAEICAVVRYANRNSGVLRLTSPSPDAFDLQDLDLLAILGRQAGASVETTRLFTLQDNQRQRAEGAAELARVALHTVSLHVAARDLISTLDRLVPSIGKAIGIMRGRDGTVEYIATSGTLDILKEKRLQLPNGVTGIAPDQRTRIVPHLSELSSAFGLASELPDEWAFIVPLSARERSLGFLVVSAPPTVPLPRRDRVTLERLSTSLAIALDALLLDEEERLAREREHLLATALTTIDHPIFILDRSGVRYANPSASREYGWSQHELMEMQFEQLIAERVPSASPAIADDAPATGISLNEHVHHRRDQSEFPAVVTTSPLLSQDGDVLGQVVSVRNVSAERRVEEQLRHTEKLVALGELVAGVAHEINNPLTGISAFAQLLLEEPLVGDQRESVTLIKQECDRAKSVIHDLLTFARRDEPVIGPVSLNELLRHALRLRAYPLRHAGIDIALELDELAPSVSGDPQKLQQVFVNLVSNAEHAMHECPTKLLTVRLAQDGDMMRIDVQDTGRGMTPDIRRRIFEPFFSTKQSGLSTGLGLSVSYGIIQAHHGRIDVTSEPGVGTTVSVRLPMPSSPIPLAAAPTSGIIAKMSSVSSQSA